MRAIIQRVESSAVYINSQLHESINKGFMILIGVGQDDETSDADWLISKIINLRVFEDDHFKMNLSLQEIKGEIMVISQFTLFASYKKGNRPSFIRSADPEKARGLYEYFIRELEKTLPGKIRSGIFGANMQVQLINNGPVTIYMDSKNKE